MGGGYEPGVVLKLACAGLPSAGKSTMINALAGARFLETGVCRTTSAPCVLSARWPNGPNGPACEWKCAEITSDDGVGLCVVDLPGVADAENTGTELNFTETTHKWAAECDVVAWVTDVRTCFLTTHEKLEYEKLKAALQVVALNEGKLFQFCVVLTKCDVEVVDGDRVTHGPTAGPTGPTAGPTEGPLGPRIKKGEIVSEHEETTVHDCIARARRLFPNDRLIPFNAFGRILTRNDTSDALKALVVRLEPGAEKHNIQLDIKWATEDLHEKRQAQMLRSILWHLDRGSTKAALYYRALQNTSAMTAYLDEEATAALVLTVLDISAPREKWHRAIVDAINTSGRARYITRRAREIRNARDSRTLGALPHAPVVATKYECEIRARFDELVSSHKFEFVAAMIRLCGPACLVTTRMYLLLPFGDDTIQPKLQHAPFWRPPLVLVPPRALTHDHVLLGYPALFELDVQYKRSCAIGAKKSWVEKVRAARVVLWGAAAESDVCVETAIALTAQGVLCSVLARIE